MLLSLSEGLRFSAAVEPLPVAKACECATGGTHANQTSLYGQVPTVAHPPKKSAAQKDRPTRNALGGRIRQAREARGLSQADLARELQLYGWDVERTVITKIELRRRCVTDFELIAIAEVLKVSLDKLAEGRPPLKKLLARPI